MVYSEIKINGNFRKHAMAYEDILCIIFKTGVVEGVSDADNE